MVPPEFRRRFTIISGSISLIQAILWSLVAIYSIGVFRCVFPVPFLDNSSTSSTISSWDFLYDTYFNGNCDYAHNWKILLASIPESSSATEIWMITYSLISSIWIPCSILLIVAAGAKVRGLYGSYLYYPWIVVTAVLILVDLIATALHLNDLFKTLTGDSYAQFITGNSTMTWDKLTWNNIAFPSQPTTYLPALYMTLFFCRGVVLWIFNIVMLVMVTKASHSVAMYKSRYQQTISLTNNANSERNWLNVFYQGPDPSLVIERTKSGRNYGINSIQGGIDSPFQNSIKDSEQESGLQMKEVERKQTSTPTFGLSKTPQSPQKWNVDEFGIPIEEIIPRVNSRRDSVERSNSFQNSGRVFDYLGRPSSFRNIVGGRSPSRGPDHLPPAELRNQMPFSYFKPMNALPPKPIQRAINAGDAPPVPVPDYTLHFNRNPATSSPNAPKNKPRVMRKVTDDVFKFPPPLSRSISEQPAGRSNQQYQYYPNPQTGVKYVPPVRPQPLAYGVQVFPQSPNGPQTPESMISGSRMLTMENYRR